MVYGLAEPEGGAAPARCWHGEPLGACPHYHPPRTCGIHGDDTTSGRCATCDAAGLRVAIVSSSEVLAQGVHLGARYWVQRGPAEPLADYGHRMAIAGLEARAAVHEGHAARLRAEAATLRERGPR